MAVLQATENVSLSAAITLTNEKNIRASVGSLTMEAGSTLINSGNLSAVQSLVSMVSETDALTNTATVMAGSGVTLYGAETVVNGEQGVDKKVIVTTTTGNISIVSDKATVTNYVDLISSGDGNITITAEQDLTNTGVAETSGGAVTFISNIGNLSNSETLNAGLGDVILRSAMGTLTNTADLTADKNILLDANKQLTNTGVLSAVKASISMITNAALTNEGTAQAKESIIMDAADTLQNTGELTAVTGELRMEGGTSLINVGNLSAGENLLMIAVDDLTNRGVVTAGAEVALYSQKGTLENYKNITADGNVLLLSKNNMTIGSSPMELSIVSKAGDVGLVTNAGDIRNYARIIAVKDNDGQGGGLVAVLSSGEMHNYGSIAAEKNVHLYGYRGLKNYTGADIVTQNGDVAINQRTNFKYKDYIDWLEPVGNVWNVGSIKVQQKGNILISTPGIPVNSETQVTNGGFLGTVDGNVILSSKGGLINGGDIYALNGGLVELTAQDSVVNSGNILIYSEGQGLGNVMLEAHEGDVINTGSFVKLSDATVTALNLPVISLIDGDILLSAEHGSVTNEHGLAAIGDITIRAQNSLTNGHLLEWEDTDYGLYSRDGNISMISHSGDIINEVGIYAGQGFVELNAGRNLRNTSKVDAGTSITVEAADMVVNGTIMSNDVYMETAKGDITIISASGEIVNASSLITGDGDVELTAKDDVTNGGSVVAHGDKQRNTGLVSITSETGDIRHTGSFYDAGNQFTYADGSIHLLAPEGAIYTSQDLIANNDIVVMSRDAVVKQESGGTIGNLGILSREQGDIYLYAYGTDEKGVVYNNGNLRTANGSIYIQANGSVEDELEIYGVKQTTQVSVYNNAAGDIHAVGGEVHINGLNTVVNKGDILVQIKNLQGGDLSIASEKGSVLLYNDGVTPESPQGTNIFLADGNICITAPSGVLYNEKNLLAKGNVDLHYGGGGMNTSITINNVIASQYGDISITTAGDLSELILASQITALEGKVDVISKGMLTIGNCADENGYTIKANDTVILNAVNDIRVYGKVKSETGSVNIASKKIAEDSNLVKFSAGTSAKQPLSKIVTIEGDIEAIQGVAAVNVVDNDFRTTIDNSTITLKNTANAAELKAESSSLIVGVAAGANSSSNGLGGGGSVVVDLFENDVIAEVKDSTINASGLQVNADNYQKIVNVAGQISIGKNAVGLAMVYNYILNNTGAYFTNSSIENSTLQDDKKVYGDSNLLLDADNESNIYAIALGISATTKNESLGAANGSVAVNRGQNNVEAVAENNGAGERHLVGLKTFEVHSKDNSYLAAATGGLTISAGKTALGGALTWNRLGNLTVSPTGAIDKDDNKKQVNKAIVSGYDIHMADNGVLKVNAEDTAKLNTVAIGVGLGIGTKFTLQGANANAYINKETTASIIGGNINQDDANYQDASHFADVKVTADTDNKFNTVSVVVATAAKAGIGAALTQNTMMGDTKANVTAGKNNSSYSVKDMLVKATSKMDLLNVDVGVAASGGVTVGGSVVDNIIANDTVAELGGVGGGITNVKSRESVGVISNSIEKFKNYSGQLNVTITGVAGGGMALALNEIKGDTIALVQNADINTDASGDGVKVHDSIADNDTTYKGLVVDADAYHDFYNAPFCGGLTVGTGGLAVGADATISADNIHGDTKAAVTATDVNKDQSDAITDNNFTVQATDKTISEAVVTNAVLTLSLGKESVGAGVGASVNTEKNNRTVEALVEGSDERKIINADKVSIKADSYDKLNAVNTAVCISGATSASGSVNAGVTYADLNVTTKAAMNGITSCNNGLTILANHKDDMTLIGTGLALAISADLFAGSVSVGVAAENNAADTSAELKNSNITHYEDGNAEDVIKAKSDSSTFTQTANVSVAVSGGFSISAGVLVADNDLKQTAKASVTDSTIGTEEKRAKSVNVLSENDVTGNFYNQNLSVGRVGLGIGVGLNTVNTGVSANAINATIYAKNDINVKATDNITLNGTMVSVTGGAIGIGVSTLHNYVGTAVVKDDYSKWNETHKDEKTGETKVSSDQMQQGEFSASKINGLTEQGLQDSDKTISGIKSERKINADTQVKKESRSATLSNDGDQVNLLYANLYAEGNIGVGASEIINTDTDLGGGSVGLLSIQVEVNRQRVTGKVGTNITGGVWQAGGDIIIDSLMSGTLKNRTIQVGIGAATVGATIGELTKEEGGTSIVLNASKMNAKGQIALTSKDSLAMKNIGVSASGGLVTGTVADFIPTDNATSTITLEYDNSTKKGNDLEAGTISIGSYSVPGVESDFTAVAVSLACGSGVIMESAANNKADIILNGDNRLWADTVVIDSGVYSSDDKYTVSADLTGVAASGLSVVLNKARTNTDIEVSTSVGSLTLKTEEETDSNGKKKKVGKSDVYIGAWDATKVKNRVKGVTVGLLIASGSNYSVSKINSTVTTKVDAGSEGLYANNLIIEANSLDTVDSLVNGDGGGIVGVNSKAAVVDAEVTGVTTVDLSGVFNVTSDLIGGAVRQDDLRYVAEAAHAQVAGASDVVWKLIGKENTNVNINNASINSGSADLQSSTTVKLNQGDRESGSNLEEVDAPYVALRSSGVAGAASDSAHLDNDWDVVNKVNVTGGSISVAGPLVLGAYTFGKIAAFNYVEVMGLIGASEANSINKIVTTDEVNIKGQAQLRTTEAGNSVTLSASDDLNVKVGSEAILAGFSGVGSVSPIVKNTIERNNKVDLEDGAILSTHDVNLYSGRKTDGTLSMLDLGLYALCHNDALIPIGCNPELDSSVTQKNVVLVEKAGQVQAIQHVNLYGDTGNEMVTKTVKGYGLSETTAVVSVQGGTTTGTDAKNCYVEVDGSVVAGVANVLDITIGTGGKLWGFVNSEDAEQVKAAYANDSDKLALIFDANKTDENISLGGDASQKAAAVAGVSTSSFNVKSDTYTSFLKNRLDELKKAMTAYKTDSKSYNALLVEFKRIENLLNISSGTSMNNDKYDIITVPDLIASGGNVNIETENFKGTGVVKAQGDPSITVTNNTNLTMKLNDVKVLVPGGIIYYNKKALDQNSLAEGVEALNINKKLPLPDMSAAKGTTATIKILGQYNGNPIAYIDADTGEKKTYKPRADVRVSGNINSMNGSVTVQSTNNDILIQGDKVSDKVVINGKVISVQALKGSVTQAYADAIVNIGGDVVSIYKNSFEKFTSANDRKSGEKSDSQGLIIKELKDGEEAPVYIDSEGKTGNYIAGEQIFINAADININGVIQSGFSEYYVTVGESAEDTAALQGKIDAMNADWSGSKKNLEDDVVLGNDNYRVVKGGAYWSSADSCYRYKLNVYYNPSNGKLLTENVDGGGGRIYLAGRIASTGNGQILCHDGAYNINVNNNLNYDLQVGSLLVNDVEGMISLVDTDTGIVTDITRSNIVTRYLNDEKEKTRTTPLENEHLKKNSDGNYTYTPDSGLRYS